ncbi:GAF domain-containing sensor histidine kinase [Rhodanobacter sp. C03]|uniref:sensor histidine kinase n=1 Tax=Rhodanobacter sp. C03 TaxID=1945858 RepID=UPI00098786A3|nr:GAF domain-containing sensor histidine kinase [Rhodanobacter sp. C03]OOG56325.1 histidine kinase [Rhodanobacter sp. C03]
MTNQIMPSTLPEPARISCSTEPTSETLRLDALYAYGILDTPPEAGFDDITRLAALICEAPIALISLVDRNRQWFKSELGLGASETPIGSSICAHAILQSDVFVVPDTLQDTRFLDNPLVTGDPHLRFYAGASLRTPDGLPLGTVCVLDRQPRQLRPEQIEALRALARQAMAQIELRRLLAQAQESNHYRRRLMAIAGHDLKTPVRTASYAIRKVQRSLSAEQAAGLTVVTEALATIDREFTQLAAMAGIEGVATTPDLFEFDLADVLGTIVTNWQQPALNKGLQLRSVATRLRVRSHPALLTTLLGNLLGNAVKYTEHGSVLIGCRRRGTNVVVEIIDTGMGMDSANSDELFSAFHQVNPHSEGLGLGLWIVRGTAESLGHPLHVRSKLGHGSRFSVELQRA